MWEPGMHDEQNLLGTTRTLDGVSGATHLHPGLVSRSGWAVYDDSHSPLLSPIHVDAVGKQIVCCGFRLLGYAHRCLQTVSVNPACGPMTCGQSLDPLLTGKIGTFSAMVCCTVHVELTPWVCLDSCPTLQDITTRKR